MKRKKLLSLFLGLCMVFGVLLLPAQEAAAVNASEVNQDVVDACNGILEVTQVITVDGNTIAYSRGTGSLSEPMRMHRTLLRIITLSMPFRMKKRH